MLVWVCGCVGVWCVHAGVGVWVCGCVGVWVCGVYMLVWVCVCVHAHGPNLHLEATVAHASAQYYISTIKGSMLLPLSMPVGGTSNWCAVINISLRIAHDQFLL